MITSQNFEQIHPGENCPFQLIGFLSYAMAPLLGMHPPRPSSSAAPPQPSSWVLPKGFKFTDDRRRHRLEDFTGSVENVGVTPRANARPVPAERAGRR